MTAKVMSAGSTTSSYRQDKINRCRYIIERVLSDYDVFSDLRVVPNITNIVIGILSAESSMDERIVTSFDRWTAEQIRKHKTMRTVSKILANIVNKNPALADEVIAPHGVGQVMGWHLISDWESEYPKIKGKNGFFSVTKTNGQSFLVGSNADPGTINSSFSGPDALENGIRSSLVLLASKYDSPKWRNMVPQLRIREAVTDYHGRGTDAAGGVSYTYANKILGGERPSVANTQSSNNVQLAKNVSSTGKTTTNSGNSAKDKWSCTA